MHCRFPERKFSVWPINNTYLWGVSKPGSEGKITFKITAFVAPSGPDKAILRSGRSLHWLAHWALLECIEKIWKDKNKCHLTYTKNVYSIVSFNVNIVVMSYILPSCLCQPILCRGQTNLFISNISPWATKYWQVASKPSHKSLSCPVRLEIHISNWSWA